MDINFKNNLIFTLIIFLTLFSLSHSLNNSYNNDTIIFSRKSGFYPNDFSLILSSSERFKIYYTIDGSNPLTSNTTKEYIEPILIKDRSEEPNIYSNYEEDEDSALSISVGQGYKKPSYPVDKGMVICAVTKNPEEIYSKVFVQTYFITTGNLELYQDYTVVSLVTSPENLFDPQKGIYVSGNLYINWKKNSKYSPSFSGVIRNFLGKGKKYEREASITIFEKGKIILEQNIGIRIKGSSTRYNQQKGFNLYARKEYGKGKMKCPELFPDNVDINGKPIIKYDSISLRGISDETRLRDQFSQSLIQGRKMHILTKMRNSVLFLNGEFWGMYAITEKHSAYFFGSHYNMSKDDIIYTKDNKIKKGPKEELNKLISFMNIYSQKDLSDENNYKDVVNFIDINSMIEHYATGIYLATFDWPNHNYGLWRTNGTKIDSNYFSDGKWRFMTFDLDYSLGATFATTDQGIGYEYEYNSFLHVDRSKYRPPANLFVALLKNDNFKKKFIETFEEYVNKVMSIDKVNKLIEEYEENATDLLGYSQTRWFGFLGGSKLEYYANAKSNYRNKILPQIKKFFEMRGDISLEHMKKYLNDLK